MYGIAGGGCRHRGSCILRFAIMFAVASLPLMLLCFWLFTPSALASDASNTEESTAASGSLSVAAAASQNDSGITAATSLVELTQNQPPDSGSTAVSSVSETTASSNTTANTSTSDTVNTADHDGGGEEHHDFELQLTCSAGEKGTYWASREDYDAHLLSIDYSLSNIGTGTAYNVRVTEATASTGVTPATTLPVMLGDLDPDELIYFTLKWLLPRGVGSFTTEITACADDKGEDEDGGEEEGGNEDGGEDLDGEKPEGDGGRLNYTSDNVDASGIDARQQGIVYSALPSTGFAGLNTAALMVALLACGFLLALPVTTNNKRCHR